MTTNGSGACLKRKCWRFLMRKYKKRSGDWSLDKLSKFKTPASKWRYIKAWEEESQRERTGWTEEDWNAVGEWAFGRKLSQLELAMLVVMYDT